MMEILLKLGCIIKKVLKTSKIRECSAFAKPNARLVIMKMDHRSCSKNIHWKRWNVAGITGTNFLIDQIHLIDLMMEFGFQSLESNRKSQQVYSYSWFIMEKAANKNWNLKNWKEFIILTPKFVSGDKNVVFQIINPHEIIKFLFPFCNFFHNQS